MSHPHPWYLQVSKLYVLAEKLVNLVIKDVVVDAMSTLIKRHIQQLSTP